MKIIEIDAKTAGELGEVVGVLCGMVRVPQDISHRQLMLIVALLDALRDAERQWNPSSPAAKPDESSVPLL